MASVLKAQLVSAAIPLARTAMRTAPGLRRAIWERVIQGRLDWREFSFVARANFGGVFSGTTADVLQRYVYYFGCWEPHVEAVIADCLRPNDTFIDVGANIGYFTLFAADRVGSGGRVVSIEAASATFKKLQESVNRNAAGATVRVIHAAVADQEGKVVLHSGPDDNSGMASMLRADNAGEEEVEAKPLGALITPQELETVRLIKIDVEGAEALVIEGMKPILPRLTNCDILVELNPSLASAQCTLDTLGEHGWKPWEILPVDSLENYFVTPLKAQLAPLTERPTRRMDVLFRRRLSESDE